MPMQENVVRGEQSQTSTIDFDQRRIAKLVAQLQRENHVIAQLMEDRQRLRREILAAQEQQLRAAHRSEKQAQIATPTLG